MADGRYEVGESRSVRSVWVWRGFFLMSLVAIGITIILATSGHTSYAVLWGVISAGWFAISMWLWRMHSTMEEQEYRRLLAERSSPPAARQARAASQSRKQGKRKR